MDTYSFSLMPDSPRPGYEQQFIGELLAKADIRLNGTEPWDIRVNDHRFYSSVLRDGSLGLGESYMAGFWDSPSPDTTLYKLLSADLETRVGRSLKIMLYRLAGRLFNGQSLKQVRRDVPRHYDLGNDLFAMMLDERMIYSCAYWQGARTLEEAQEKKLDLICRKLHLERGQRLLDIGCGWGGLAGYAAEKYGVEVVGITLSEEQARLARERHAHLPVTICLQDYRNLTGQFDRVVSVGMMEHVGYKNYRRYMQVVHQALKADGLFLLHCIGSDTSVNRTDPWINRYIFPNGMMPSLRQIAAAAEGLWVMEDWHNFGTDYDLTLMEWRRRFNAAWPALKAAYSETFYRMWDYYLCCSAASFRAKKNKLWQMVFSKPGNHRIYTPVR
ncbi:cyclopropane fatty acyl phospholipid synthase [Mucilaginibacter sp. UR6-11]|uniref:cyclopropane fatty acyl phospholipid synthase n=1 Tax=Mucilaginibacter sp. UR6-11 TaxID=1435644 RepID=UPI001E508F97|nr:cyclopropane fatty acyl phospholipid synthase [Mucilaginibacter sp. UR6-11]MCC8426416.1 cyclopropane fatty acyl phospholipid synthase [Mucilaginibacter sp. UR6-11]